MRCSKAELDTLLTLCEHLWLSLQVTLSREGTKLQIHMSINMYSAHRGWAAGAGGVAVCSQAVAKR
jgi:hypothetical protein